ncbi:hypothetical protein [Actinorugispora endophytica]|uniref:Uncharacterized protein n=1 Tax=Actinorugispora endophytica TaxID=1605990 RepID=A0A4R6V6H0_9ACTN|nr:hypothetical protein [Actinorugispora endophytica]TDQ54782.1 hypothetical protein EV190_10198 [Actinorugispora endophytica]
MDSENISCSQVTGSISSGETLRITGEEESNGVSTTHWAESARWEGLADDTAGWARSGYEGFLETGIELGEINFDLWVDQQNRPVILSRKTAPTRRDCSNAGSRSH